MTTSSFLQKETILLDMQNHAIQIGKVLNAEVSIVDRENKSDHVFGYLINPRDSKECFEVFMYYDRDEKNNFGVKNKEWSIVHKGEETNGYRTIGDVFNFIQKKL